MLLVLYRYSQDMFGLPNSFTIVLKIFWASLLIIQFPAVLAARNHYSIDLAVSMYLAPLIWYWYSMMLNPTDKSPIKAD